MKKFSLDEIKKRRQELNLTTSDVANLLGFKNASVYWKYENGQYKFNAEILPLLAKVLKCEPEHFFL